MSESAWLFAVFGVLGATLGLDGSPMRWPSLLVIMGVATLLARLRPSFIAAFSHAALQVPSGPIVSSS